MNGRSKRSLMLIEISILLLFFAFSAAICVNMFATAKTRSTEANDLNRAMLLSQSAAECFKASGGDLDEVAYLCDAFKQSDKTLVAYYDYNNKPCDISQAIFILNLEVEKLPESGIVKAIITITKDDTVIYEITAGTLYEE